MFIQRLYIRKKTHHVSFLVLRKKGNDIPYVQEKIKTDSCDCRYPHRLLFDLSLIHIFTFSDGDKSIEKEIKITVHDTKKPEIVLKKDKITITAGDKLNLKDNVKSVKDPVDGDLKYSDKEIKKSGYTIDKGKLNVKKTGTYKVTVKAYDANENTTDKTFDVVVKKKAEKKTTTEQSSEAIASQNNNTGQQTQSASPSSPAQSNQNSGSSGQSGTASGGSSSGNSGTSKPAEIQLSLIHI